MSRRLQGTGDRVSNVLDVNQRAPRGSVAGHFYFFSRPGKPREVIEYQIETHVWRSAIGSRVSEKRWRKVISCHGRDISFDQGFAFCIGCLRMSVRLLGFVLARTGPVNAARGSVHESRNTYSLTVGGKSHGSQVVNAVSQCRIVLSERIVRQLRQMNNGVESLKVPFGNLPKILVNTGWVPRIL